MASTRLLLGTTFLLLVLILPTRARAQDDHDFQTWTAFLGAGKVGADSRLRSWFDGHVRRGDAGTVVIVRPALGYQMMPWLSVWAGYAWVPVFPDAGDRVDEHRAWQQAILTHTALGGAVHLQSRTRFEQRFVDDFDTGFRVRQFVRADYRFGPKPRWGLVAWDELFIGLNDPDFAPQGFDQNRVFLGPAFFAHERLRVEFGYLWAVLDRDPLTLHQHALAINFFVKLDV